MDDKLTIISRAMQNLDKAARLEIKTEEDKLLIASALMAVTRKPLVPMIRPMWLLALQIVFL